MEWKDIFDLSKRGDRVILAIFLVWLGLQIFLLFYAGNPWGIKEKAPSDGRYYSATYWKESPTKQFYSPWGEYYSRNTLFNEQYLKSTFDYTEVLVYSILPWLFLIAYKLIKPNKR